MPIQGLKGKFNVGSSLSANETAINGSRRYALYLPLSVLRVKGALTYFLGCVAKEYVCGITWTFFATHRSFYNTALVINIEIEQ